MEIAAIFIDRRSRLRSGWRFAIFFVSFLLFGTLFGGAVTAILYSLPIGFTPGTATALTANALIGLVPALVLGWLCGKYIEGLPFRALGASATPGWLRNFIVGLIGGVAALALAVLIASIFGGLTFEINREAGITELLTTLGTSFLIFAVAAAFEEVLFRGYMLQTFMRSGLTWFGIVLTSVLFASVHFANPGATALSGLNTFLAGVWFSVAYWKTRDLWLVWSLHLAWNWAQGSIFGVEVSGLTDIMNAPLLREIDTGPEWLTGGAYGIEGGIACTVGLILSTIAIYFVPFLKPSSEMLELTGDPSELPA